MQSQVSVSLLHVLFLTLLQPFSEHRHGVPADLQSEKILVDVKKSNKFGWKLDKGFTVKEAD